MSSAEAALLAAVRALIADEIRGVNLPLPVVQAPRDNLRAFSVAETAERLGVSRRTVERIMAAGRLPFVRVTPTHRRISATALAAFIDAGT